MSQTILPLRWYVASTPANSRNSLEVGNSQIKQPVEHSHAHWPLLLSDSRSAWAKGELLFISSVREYEVRKYETTVVDEKVIKWESSQPEHRERCICCWCFASLVGTPNRKKGSATYTLCLRPCMGLVQNWASSYKAMVWRVGIMPTWAKRAKGITKTRTHTHTPNRSHSSVLLN